MLVNDSYLEVSHMNYHQHNNILLAEHKSIYLFVPKTGCTSFKTIISQNLGLDIDYVHHYTWPYALKNKINSERYKDYFKFTIVRNPWDRAFSAFLSKIKQNKNKGGKRMKNGVYMGLANTEAHFYAGMSFKDYLRRLQTIFSEMKDSHFTTQYSILTDDAGVLLPNFIGRFESLSAHSKEIALKLGWSYDSLPHINKTNSNFSSYKEAYDNETEQIVRELYKDDIENFGYEF